MAIPFILCCRHKPATDKPKFSAPLKKYITIALPQHTGDYSPQKMPSTNYSWLRLRSFFLLGIAPFPRWREKA
jgi:hypothetical protein